MKRLLEIRTRFNAIVILSIVMIVFLQLSCGNSFYFTTNPRKFLSLVKPIEQDGVKLRHIEIHDVIIDSMIILDDRVMINKMRLSKADRIQVLKEYLSFRGDITRSNKSYPVGFGRGENRLKVIYDKMYYSIEVEALYSFTSMLFYGSTPISPILIKTKTGDICNSNRTDLDEVYKCYYKWFKRMEKTNFSNLTWPLENSGYHWLGQLDNIERLLKKDLY